MQYTCNILNKLEVLWQNFEQGNFVLLIFSKILLQKLKIFHENISI